MTAPRTPPARFSSRRKTLFGTAIFVGVSAWLALLSPRYLTPELVGRLFGVMTAASLVYYASASAKALRPLASMRGSPAAEQRTRRFTAWSITLGGLGYALAMVVVPANAAPLVAVAILGSALVLAYARCVWIRTRGSHA